MLLNCGVGQDSWETLDCKEIQPVHPKGIQSWMFIGRTDVEAETPILWLPDAKSWLIWKDPDAGKDWRQEEKGMTEDEMVGWHHQLTGHEFEQTPGNGEGLGSLAYCSPWGCKILDMTEWQNNNKMLEFYSFIIFQDVVAWYKHYRDVEYNKISQTETFEKELTSQILDFSIQVIHVT